VFPDCPHHQIANSAARGSAALLSGVVVEGPASHGRAAEESGMKSPHRTADQFAAFNRRGAVFVDKVQSYNTVEPAIDLTARSFLMFAWGIAGAPEGAEANWLTFPQSGSALGTDPIAGARSGLDRQRSPEGILHE